MKKEFIKFYIEWLKSTSFDVLKNRIVLKMNAYDIYSIFNKRNTQFWDYADPYYKKRIFINLRVQIKIFDSTYKLQSNSAFISRYFVY